MSFFRIIGILLLLALPMGCSQCNSGKEGDQAPSISEIEGVEGDNQSASPQGVVLIESSVSPTRVGRIRDAVYDRSRERSDLP